MGETNVGADWHRCDKCRGVGYIEADRDQPPEGEGWERKVHNALIILAAESERTVAEVMRRVFDDAPDRAQSPERAVRWAVEQPTIGCDEPSYYVYHSRYAAEVAASESDFLRVVRIVVIPTDRRSK